MRKENWMRRRRFLQIAAACAGSCALGWPRMGIAAETGLEPHRVFDRYFLEITRGFLRNALRTGPDFDTCDFPDGTKLKGCCTPSGRTYTSLARTLPAIAEFVVARPGQARIEVDRREIDLLDVLVSFFQHAFDPKHPDYWGEPPRDRA